MNSDLIHDLVRAVTYLEYQMLFVEEDRPWLFDQHFFRVPRTAYPVAPELSRTRRNTSAGSRRSSCSATL